MRLLLPLLLLGCSTTHGIKPVGKGAVSVEGSLGGPVTMVFGAPIPLPLTTVGATVGATDTTDVHAAIHPTAAAMFGLGAGDIGVSQQFLDNEGGRPRLMGDLTFTGAFGDRDPDVGHEGGFRGFLQPSVTASWDWGKQGQCAAYTGLTAFLEPADEFQWLGGLYLGNRFAVGKQKRGHVDIELKWLDFWASSEPIVPEFVTPGNLGALELQFAYGYRFGGKP